MFKTSGDGDLTNVILKVYGLKFAKAVMPVDILKTELKYPGLSVNRNCPLVIVPNRRFLLMADI